MRKSKSGFTIVELIIVIVVIAILAAIAIVSYNGVQSRARDSKRVADISNIKKALDGYNILNGGVRRTSGGAASYTNGVVYAGWDSSISPNWLAFLEDSGGKMPVDPRNTLTVGSDPSSNGNFAYFYYCYAAGGGSLPATDNVRLGYHKDDGSVVYINFAVKECLP